MLERHESTTALAREWDELADRTGASPLMRPGWFEAWWSAFGSGRMEIAALRRDGRLVAVLPLRRRRLGLQSLFNWHQMEYTVVAEDDAARSSLFQALLQEERRPVAMRFLVKGTPDHELFRAAACSGGRWVNTRVLERSPYLDCGDGDWERYLASVERRRLADLRRRQRRLGELGELRFRVSDGGENLEEDLAAGFALEGSGWKHGTAINDDPAALRFYTDVARWAAASGYLQLAFLELDGRPFAFDFELVTETAVYQLKGGYDPAMRKFAPGILMRFNLIAKSFADGLTRVEFLGNANADKLIWTDAVHERMLLHAFPRSPSGLTLRTAETYGRPVARRARAALRR